MASSFAETQITWSAAASVTLTTASRVDSDAMTLNAETDEASVMVSVDNAGTPGSGDIVQVYLKRSAGDVLGDTGDDYETDEHAFHLGPLDTFATNNPGEDPTRKMFEIPTSAAKFRVSVEAPQAATRNVVVRARLVEHRRA